MKHLAGEVSPKKQEAIPKKMRMIISNFVYSEY